MEGCGVVARFAPRTGGLWLAMALTLALLPVSTRPAGAVLKKLDRHRDRLTGPVKTVQIEIAKVTSRAGVLQENYRIPWLSMTYDPRGDKIEENQLYSDSHLNFKSVFAFEAEGLPKEGAEYDHNGTLEFSWVYTVDAAKNRIEENRFYAEKKGLFSRSTYLYDESGNLIEETRYHVDSTNDFKWTYRYDAAGNKVEETFFVVNTKGLSGAGKSVIDSKTIFRYDSKGSLIEETRFDPSGSVRSKKLYTYEFDQAGNWVKQIARELAASSGSLPEPTEVTYRVITYY